MPRIIDLVTAPLPEDAVADFPLLRQWLERVRLNPTSGLLDDISDKEL